MTCFFIQLFFPHFFYTLNNIDFNFLDTNKILYFQNQSSQHLENLIMMLNIKHLKITIEKCSLKTLNNI